MIDGETGVTVKACAKTEKASVTKKNNKLMKGKLHYGSFVKSGTLENGKIRKQAVDSDCSSSDSDSEGKSMKKSTALTDEELFAACGGRTAHKGARHGLKLSAKLARLEEQESMDVGGAANNSNSKSSKAKKRKRHTFEEKLKPTEQANDDQVKSKKKKRKNHSKDENELSPPICMISLDKVASENVAKCKHSISKKKKRRTKQDMKQND